MIRAAIVGEINRERNGSGSPFDAILDFPDEAAGRLVGPSTPETESVRTIFSLDHKLHAPEVEWHRGKLVAPIEAPYRMDLLLGGLKQAGFDEFHEPESFDDSVVASIHSEPYLHFLQTAAEQWRAAGYAGDVVAMTYPRGTRRAEPPADIDGAVGYFCLSSDTAITDTTWKAAKHGADCAQSAAAFVAGGGSAAFSLSRPPGHHAGADYMGGYCFLNTAAISAQHLRDHGAAKVAILDVDFHHGNGTQDIFYHRSDVLYASIHGNPEDHFPYFWGHQDEVGEQQGDGFNLNYPLPAGTSYQQWNEALQSAVKKIRRFAADALVVSLGVDAFEHDPFSSFLLKTEDFRSCGQTLAGMSLPTVFVMEGGYTVTETGTNVAAVLAGFLNA